MKASLAENKLHQIRKIEVIEKLNFPCDDFCPELLPKKISKCHVTYPSAINFDQIIDAIFFNTA